MASEVDATDDLRDDATQRRLVDVDAVAAALGINRWTIYRWARAGRIPSFGAGRKVRFQLGEVIARLRREPSVAQPPRVSRPATQRRASTAAPRELATPDHDARRRAAVAATRALAK